jgi:hypothetical protein
MVKKKLSISRSSQKEKYEDSATLKLWRESSEPDLSYQTYLKLKDCPLKQQNI